MRTISSPHPSCRTPVSSPSPNTPLARDSVPPCRLDQPAETTSTAVTPKSLPSPSVTSQPAPAPDSVDLAAENGVLREQLEELKGQFQCVLDHSIESDARLLQFTDQVFVANTSQLDSSTRASVADCGVQCDLTTTCGAKECVENRVLVNNLKTTIEVLEAELQCLRRKARESDCGGEKNVVVPDWTVVHRRGCVPIKTTNKFHVLGDALEVQMELPASQIPVCMDKSKKKKKKPKRNTPKEKVRKTTQQNNPPQKISLPFHSVKINGDSHSRNVAGLLRSMVTSQTAVDGVCKPGAKLLDVISDNEPSPGSCSVIIAGTNDLAAGQQHNIYKHLESCIVAKTKTAAVIVSTLPLRHDLPAHHPINEETALVNAYIEELCARHRGVRVMDFNRIGRSAFSNHGMHLKPQSKQLLARLLLECLQGFDHIVPAAEPTSSPSTQLLRPSDSCQPPVLEEPKTLAYESFAEAVKQVATSTAQNVQKNCVSPACAKKG